MVDDLNARGIVPPALAMAYVKTRCVLHGFAAARVERGEPIETHDLETRARAEIALRAPRPRCEPIETHDLETRARAEIALRAPAAAA